ncbi:MAG TPA: biotin/lipoyl-containing protein [Candidatus Acidoferrales bacterium]|jgi:biotin carboxyl carrier protein|nr:biotin/lipoyl-containing protein [Candidatus Acidoferrales bacterium]
MKSEVRIGGRVRKLDIERTGPKQFAVVCGTGDKIDGNVDVDVFEVAPNAYSIIINGRAFEAIVMAAAEGVVVRCNGHDFHATLADPRAWRGGRGAVFGAEGKQKVMAPMPGKVVRVLVNAGDKVAGNQGLVVVEAMKMQNEIRAPNAGTIERIFVKEGQTVATGELLVTIE